MFGTSCLMDHAFVIFDMPDGGSLHIPCGTIPTCLVEKQKMMEEGDTAYETAITVAVPSQVLTWTVAHSADEVQALLREGLMKLNQEAPGPAPLPFQPS